ncbi:MAG: hypothetical protein ACXQT2_02495 [Methanotrichaceae archaeon]
MSPGPISIGEDPAPVVAKPACMEREAICRSALLRLLRRRGTSVRAEDMVGIFMRGGKIFVRDCVGYRAVMHMKKDEAKRSVLVIGGAAQDFFGEYFYSRP